MKKLISCIIISIVVLLYITVCYGGDRRTNNVYNNGDWIMLLDVGECDNTGCVIYEHTTQGGLLYQRVDKDDDSVCDIIRVWKPLVDPTWGTFYTLYKYKLCKGSI